MSGKNLRQFKLFVLGNSTKMFSKNFRLDFSKYLFDFCDFDFL